MAGPIFENDLSPRIVFAHSLVCKLVVVDGLRPNCELRVPLSGDVIIVVSIRERRDFRRPFFPKDLKNFLCIWIVSYISGILVEVSLRFIGYDSLGIGILRDLGIG